MKHKDSRKVAKREEAVERRLDRSWGPKDGGPVLRRGSVRYGVSDRVQAVGCGGIGLMRQLVRSLGLAESIDRRVGVLKRHLPYHESDHVLNLTYNILSGGECLQDVEGKRRDPAYLDALGARKLPAASTEGDFLRRFGAEDALALQEAANEARLKAWALQGEEFLERATLDVDGTTAPTAGECKEGIGLNHEGVWGYGPLVVSLAETGEALYTVNRPANRASHEGFAEWIDRAVALAREAGFRRTRVRGDTDFALTVHFDHWTEDGVEFVFGKDAARGLVRRAEAIPESAWADLERKPKGSAAGGKRKRRGNVKQRIVRQNGYRRLTLEKEREAARLARMEFRSFLRGVIPAPCQIVRTGRRTVFRLLGVNEWSRTLLEGSLWLSKQRL